MSAKSRAAYSHHLVAQGKRPLEYWPHTSSVIARPAVQDDMTKEQTYKSGGKQVPYPCNCAERGESWCELHGYIERPATVRPPAPEVTPDSLRTLAAEMRADASRWLSRANDLEAAAKRLEGE